MQGHDERIHWVPATDLNKGDRVTLRNGDRIEILDNCRRCISRLSRTSDPILDISMTFVWDMRSVSRNGNDIPVRMTTSQRARHDRMLAKLASNRGNK